MTVDGAGLLDGPDPPLVGRRRARRVVARRPRRSASSCPAARRRPAPVRIDGVPARRRASTSARRSRPACIRSTARPSIARATCTSPTAAPRGQEAPVSLFRVRAGRRARAVRRRHRRIRRRWRSGPTASCTSRAASKARSTGVEADGSTTVVRDRPGRGVRAGVRPDGTLFVGDRSGTHLPRRPRTAGDGVRDAAGERRRLSPRVRARRLALRHGADAASCDLLYRVDAERRVDVAVRRLRPAAGPRLRRRRLAVRGRGAGRRERRLPAGAGASRRSSSRPARACRARLRSGRRRSSSRRTTPCTRFVERTAARRSATAALTESPRPIAAHTRCFRRQADRRALVATRDRRTRCERVLGAGDLVMLAIGAVIGAGIFGAIGTAAAGQIGAGRRGRSATAPGRRWCSRSCCSAAPARWRRSATPSWRR